MHLNNICDSGSIFTVINSENLSILKVTNQIMEAERRHTPFICKDCQTFKRVYSAAGFLNKIGKNVKQIFFIQSFVHSTFT